MPQADIGHQTLKPGAIIGLRAAAPLVLINDHHQLATPTE
jgi:hypothetical protein